MTSDLHVPKITVPVQLLLDGDSDFQECEWFLCPLSSRHAGAETLVESLNQKDTFLPVRVAGSIFVVNIDAIVAVRGPAPAEGSGIRNVRIHCTGGVQLDAMHCEPLPEEHGRTVDFLNLPGRFCEYRDRESVLLINRAKIVRVEDR